MGDFTLGALLGQYDRAQSFDVDSAGSLSQVQSWAKADQTSWYFVGCAQATHVHSSQQALKVEVFSRSGSESILSYAYGQPEDAYRRWFPEVDTHAVATRGWMLVDPITSSGDYRFQLFAGAGAFEVLPGKTFGTDPLRHHRLATTVSSEAGGTPRVGIHIPDGAAVNSTAAVYVDDVLTTVDELALQPEWTFRERAQLIRTQHRTRTGELHDFVWEKYFAYSVPLQFLSDSHAPLLNWWWENQFNLLFTLDTSDSESLYVVRIVNGSQPIDRRMRPYADRWRGTLRLESAGNGALDF